MLSPSEHIESAQTSLAVFYSRQTASAHFITSLAAAIPVVAINECLEVVKKVAQIIENIAYAAIHLFGAAFHEECSIRGAVQELERGAKALSVLPAHLLFMPARAPCHMYNIAEFGCWKAREIGYGTHYGTVKRPF